MISALKKIRYNSCDEFIYVYSRYEYDRSMGCGYYRGLILRCEKAEERIVNIINNNNNKYYKIINDETQCELFKIRNINIDWNCDESALLFETMLIKDNDFKQSVLKLIYDKICENEYPIINNELNNIVVKKYNYSLIIDKIIIINLT